MCLTYRRLPPVSLYFATSDNNVLYNLEAFVPFSSYIIEYILLQFPISWRGKRKHQVCL